jgi:hypothetical protein
MAAVQPMVGNWGEAPVGVVTATSPPMAGGLNREEVSGVDPLPVVFSGVDS